MPVKIKVRIISSILDGFIMTKWPTKIQLFALELLELPLVTTPSASNISGGFMKRVMPTIADKRIHDNIEAEHVPDFSKLLLSLSSRVVDGSIAFESPLCNRVPVKLTEIRMECLANEINI